MEKLITVINDDPPFLELMHELLEEEGYKTLLLCNAGNAYEVVREAMPDAVILDMRLEHPGDTVRLEAGDRNLLHGGLL